MPKRKASFYGVRVGNKPGVYEDWEECKRQVTGFPGNEYKSFSTRLEAEDYVQSFVQGSKTQEGKVAVLKEDTKNGSPARYFKQGTADLMLYGKGVATREKSSLVSQLSDMDRSKFVKLVVEENGGHFFCFNSLKDFDLYFESLAAQSNHLDEDVLGNKSLKVCARNQEQNTIPEGVVTLKKKVLTDDEEFVYFKSQDELQEYLKPYFIQRLKEDHATIGIRCSSEFRADQELVSTVAHDPELSASGVYQIEFDGASKGNPGRAGAGALIRCPHGRVVVELAEFLGNTTNNVAEYKSLILGLTAALSKGFQRVRAQGDSKLVCLQINGAWKVENEKLIPLFQEVKRLQQSFKEFSIAHVRREFNSQADALANDAVLLGETEPVRKIVKPIPQCCIPSN